MRSARLVAALLSLLMLMSVSAQAGVSVNFVHPEKFRDEDFRRSFKRDGIIAEFRKYFDRLGAIYLKKGQTLRIDVLNADLAGRYEPWNGLYDVRVLRDVTPPSFRLRYTLRQGKKIVARGEETVTDMNYLWDMSARNSSGRFAYEKSMLRDWFRKRFSR
jgi:hypothetical protein